MDSHVINGGLYNIGQIISSECAELEFEAISVMASLESEMERSCLHRPLITKFEKDDDDDLSEVFLRIEDSEPLLEEDLSRVDLLKYKINMPN